MSTSLQASEHRQSSGGSLQLWLTQTAEMWLLWTDSWNTATKNHQLIPLVTCERTLRSNVCDLLVGVNTWY